MLLAGINKNAKTWEAFLAPTLQLSQFQLKKIKLRVITTSAMAKMVAEPLAYKSARSNPHLLGLDPEDLVSECL